jgi:hypothetical protein
MRGTLQFLTFFLAALFVLGGAPMAQAQHTPKVEVFGGYSYLRASTVSGGTQLNLKGASGSVAYNLKSWLGVVGDVGFYRQGRVAGNGFSLTLSSYQIGPRLSLRHHTRLVPFGQVLLGAGHAGGTRYTSSPGTGLAPLGTNYGFLLTAGGGVDLKLNYTVGIRVVQAEYLYSQFLNGSGNNRQSSLRLSAGLVFSFGERGRRPH